MRPSLVLALGLLLSACGGDDGGGDTPAEVTYVEACTDVCPDDPLSCPDDELGCACQTSGEPCSSRAFYCSNACFEETDELCAGATMKDCTDECTAEVPGDAWCPPTTPELACSDCPVSAICNDGGCECDDGTLCEDR